MYYQKAQSLGAVREGFETPHANRGRDQKYLGTNKAMRDTDNDLSSHKSWQPVENDTPIVLLYPIVLL